MIWYGSLASVAYMEVDYTWYPSILGIYCWGFFRAELLLAHDTQINILKFLVCEGAVCIFEPLVSTKNTSKPNSANLHAFVICNNTEALMYVQMRVH